MALGCDLLFEKEDVQPILNLIEEVAGLHFEPNKHYFTEKRILARMRATNSKSVQDYFRLVKLSQNIDELQELICALTTNETYFYRNIPQLESFAEDALPLLIERKMKKGDYSLRIWSAACSSGEEPYNIMLLLKEHLPNFKNWDIEIIATDIDHHVLEKAEIGIYEKRQVKQVPSDMLKKYFSPRGNQYKVSRELKRQIQFKQSNLMDRREMRQFKNMDFVFCRNVLIYFNDESKKQIINSIYDSLNLGGFIFMGHAESVGKISALFKLVKFKKCLAYQK